MTGVECKNYSMDARLVTVISEQLQNGNYLEIYLRGGELVHAFVKSNWASTLTFGVVGWGEPYLYVTGVRNENNEKLLEEIREMMTSKRPGFPSSRKLEYAVQDHLYEE